MFGKRLRYELRVAFGLTSLLPLPGLAGFGLLEWLMWRNSPDGAMQMFVLRDFSLFLPLIAGLSAAHLMSVEKEERFDELRHSYSEPLCHQSLWRTLIALLLTSAALGLGWASYSLVIKMPVPLQWILPALPPTLYLMGLSMLINHLTGSYWGAAGVVMGYWFLEVQLQTRGRLTGDLFLFNGVWDRGGSASLNTILLCMVGCAFLIINALIDHRPMIRSRFRSQLRHE